MSSAADRMRRLRQRRKLGAIVALVELLPEDTDRLVEAGLITDEETGDSAALNRALRAAILRVTPSRSALSVRATGYR